MQSQPHVLATIMHPKVTATNAPISTEPDRPSHGHGHMHRAIHLGGPHSHMHTDTGHEHLQRHTGKNTLKDACLFRPSRGEGEDFSFVRAHTRPYSPRHPFLPIPDPLPPLPSHLPGPIPSIKLPKQVSQQPGRGKASVCLLPTPTRAPAGCARPSPHAGCQARDAYNCCTGTAQRCSTWRRPSSPASQASPPPPAPCPNPLRGSLATPELGSLSGCQGRFGSGLWGLKQTLPPPTPGSNFRGSR